MSGAPFLRRWATVVSERFPPVAHVALIGAFFAGNAPDVVRGGGTGALHAAAAAAATLLVFFRMRVFDEIKDHATDVRLHPERPLARRLVSVREAKTVAFSVAAVEGLLAAACGASAFTVWTGVLAFTLLMYREFFLGTWLRPRMELYAVTHTFVVVGIGAFVAVAAGGAHGLDTVLLAAAAGNWAVFNDFEFARKTFAPEEEKPGIETYSLRWGPRGAVTLTMANVAVAAAAMLWTARASVAPLCAAAVVLFAVAVAVPYLLAPRAGSAAFYRRGMGVFLFGYYVLLAVAPRSAGGGG